MADIEVRGGADIQRVARELKKAGDGTLRRETLRGIRNVAKPVIPEIRASAERRLPKRGGLGARVAAQPFGVRTSLAAGKVTIGGKGMKELNMIDEGTVRHPTFAHRRSLFSANLRGAGEMVGRRAGEWHSQKVVPGFFRRPILVRQPKMREAILKVIAETAKKIH